MKRNNTDPKGNAHHEPRPAANNPSPRFADLSFDILENLDAIVLVAELPSHTIIYANKYALNLLGNIIGKTCWNSIHGEAAGPCSFCSTSYLLVDNEKQDGSLNFETRNSITQGWYDVHEKPLRLLDGREVRILLATDITDKKTIDSKLRKSEEKYRTVADYTYDWECWMNEKRQFEYVSPSCQRVTGYRADEFLADPALIKRIIHPEHRAGFIRHQDKAFQSSKYSHFEFRILAKDGTIKWISHYCQPVYGVNGEFRGRRSSNRDITEKKQAENRTKLNELRLSTLISLYEKKELDADRICDFVLESSLPITSSSIGFLGFLDENESVVTIHSWSRTVMQECAVHRKPIEFKVQETGMWGEAIRRKQPFVVNDYSAESPLKKGAPEGHVAIGRFMTVPLVWDDRVIAIVVVGNKEEPYTEDDTDQLQLLLEGMWQILLRKGAEKKLIRQSKKIRHFASAVAHDLKSPALSIYGFARTLQQKYAHDLDEQAVHYCEQIMKNAEQVSLLAEDISTIITTRDAPADFELLELKEIWNTVREEFVPQLRERNINWREPEIETVTIVGNRIGLLRILRNLIDNALKYGGPRLSEITLGYEVSESHHILLVGNNGETILQEDEQVIFQEFKRKPKSPQIYGTGLGLAIVKEIASKHRGRSWLTKGECGNPVFCVSIAQDLESEQ